ncbi:MAG TPA: PaaI family thioesterase [Terriglobales bacterium]|nr:PaaI family thioesterase [Terriglobales bacterium]
MKAKHTPPETTAPHKNFCFACGPDNAQGMRLKFRLAEDGKHFICNFRLGRRYTGPPGHCHGGIIATVLDDAMGKLCKLRNVRAVTSRMTVHYLKPVPLFRPLRVCSHEVRKRGRRLTHAAEITDAHGTVLARGRGVFIIIDPERVFGKKL